MPYFLLILIALIWGSQYVFNVIALQELSAFGLMALRLLIGMLTLSILIKLIPSERHQKLQLTPKLWGLFILIGAVEAAIPFFLIAYGQGYVHASITAIIMGLIPMMTLLLAIVMKEQQKISSKEILALILAFVGLIILIDPTDTNLYTTFIGFIAIATAALCFALALILMAKIPKKISSLHATRFILLIYSLPLSLIWLTQNYEQLPTATSTYSSLIFLGIFSSGIVYLLYLKLIRSSGPSFTALSNFLVPLVGTFLGVYFFDEPFKLNTLIALIMIILALFVTTKPSQNL